MGIQFVGSGSLAHASTSAQTYNFSSLLDGAGGTPTLQEGDLVLINLNYGGTSDQAQSALMCKDPSAANYTAAHTDLYINDSRDCNQQVQYKFMGATPDASVTIPAVLSTLSMAVTIHVFRGVDPTTPLDVTPTTATGNNSSVANPPSITPSSAGAWIIACGAAAVDDGTASALAKPASAFQYNEGTNLTQAAHATGGTASEASVCTTFYSAWTSGAFDPPSFVSAVSAATHSWSAVTIALRPKLAPKIQFVGKVENHTSSSVSLSSFANGIRSSLQEGDFLVLVGYAAGSTDGDSSVASSGWTEQAELYSNDTNDAHLLIATKFMGATPDTTVSWSPVTGAGASFGVIVYAFQGIDPNNPLDVAIATATGLNSRLPNPPSITPVTAGALIFVAGSGAMADGAVGGGLSPTNLHQIAGDTSTFGASFDATAQAGFRNDWVSGAFDPPAWTAGSGSSNDSWCAVTMALRPAPPTGVLAKTLGAITASATGKLTIAGTLSKTLGALSLTATAKLPAAGTLSSTLGTITVSSAGKLAIAAALNKTLGSFTLTATGTISDSGGAVLSVTLGSITAAATGQLLIKGTASKTLGALTLSATGSVALKAQATITLGAVTLAAAGTTAPRGALSATLGSITLAATGQLPLKAALTKTLGSITSTATSTLLIQGSAALTLSPITLSGSISLVVQATPTAGRRLYIPAASRRVALPASSRRIPIPVASRRIILEA